MDRERARVLRERIQETLDGLAAELDVRIIVDHGTYSPNNCVYKLQVAEFQNGQAMTREAEAFKRLANLYGVDLEALGKTFQWRGHEFTVVGLNTRRVKYPILADSAEGRRFKFPMDVLRLVEKAPTKKKAKHEVPT